MNIDLITALILGLAGFSIGVRQIVLSPRNSTYPAAPPAVRFAMFLFAAALGGSAVLFYGQAEVAGAFAGEASGIIAFLMGGVAAYNVVMLINVLMQRYPAEVWRRLNRATDAVKRSCPERKMVGAVPLHVQRR